VLLYDGGTHLVEVQSLGIARYVIRLALNSVARRNQLPNQGKRRGRPQEYGAYVRPLARCWQERNLAATPADVTATFTFQERMIAALAWHGLVRADQKASPDQPTFTIWVFHDPNYRQPLVVATNLD